MTLKTWPTEDRDLEIAENIIQKHIDFNDGQPLGLFENWRSLNQSSDYRIADWLLEISDLFIKKYGKQHGTTITQHVISRCLISDETVH